MDKADIPASMTDALARFDSGAESIVKPFTDSVESRQPGLIYHYTNDLGLKGILETGQIWLTDIFKLNDPSELSHGVSFAVDALSERAANGPSEAQKFAKLFADFHERGIQETAHYFVCSFSSNGDELGQWRAYADNGRGCALGFDGNALEEAFTKENDVPIYSNNTFFVTYDDSMLADLHYRIIDSMLALISLPRGRILNPQSSTLTCTSCWVCLRFTHCAPHCFSSTRLTGTKASTAS